jgi:hypothetical protein
MARRVCCCVFVIVFAAVGVAQEAAGPLGALRGRSELSDADRAEIRSFISGRVQDIVAGDPLQARQSTIELRDAAAGEGVSSAFRQAYAVACVEVIGSAFKKADLTPAVRLVTVLNTLRTPAAVPVQLEALRDDRVAVRAAGAIGLRLLRTALAQAGEEALGGAINGLKAAALKEKSRDTLRALYGALDMSDVPNVPNPRAAATALLDVLEARAALYTGDDVAALGADDYGLRVIGKALERLNDQQREQLAGATARMVRYAVERYSGATKLAAVADDAARQQVERRNAVERLIVVGEALLTRLLPGDDARPVTQNMENLETASMRVEWNQRWAPRLQTALGSDFAIADVPTEEG